MAARVMVGLGAIAAGVVGWVSPAFACGGLVGENGTIQLVRTSTLAAYHDGVERYVTSSSSPGEGEGGRLDRARCPACPPRSSAAATGRCNGWRGRSRRRRPEER